MLRLYNTATVPLRLLATCWGALRATDSTQHREWSERRARRLPDCAPHGIWVHGSSVGEARLVTLLAGEIRRRLPARAVAVSAFTPTGRAQLPEPPEVDAAFFMPLDFSGYPARVLRALRPAALALVETELWPNLIVETHAAGVPIALLNGRLSAARMGRYRRLSALYGPLLSRIDRVGAQTAEDAARFVELGVRPGAVQVQGNIKYDLPPASGDRHAWRRRLGLDEDRPVFVAGSTGVGEEAPVLQAFVEARRQVPALVLVLAPRHPRRADEVERLIERQGLRSRRLSLVRGDMAQADVLLVDSVGQLGELYMLARVAFVGGSLVPVGGHNLLEPVACGVPVLFGPHTDHVREPAETLEQAGAAQRVASVARLGAVLTELLQDESRRREMVRRGSAVLSANRGALKRGVTLLRELLEADGAGA